jgi:hypothetical protein
MAAQRISRPDKESPLTSQLRFTISAGHHLRGATLIVQFTITDEFRLPALLAQMF